MSDIDAVITPIPEIETSVSSDGAVDVFFSPGVTGAVVPTVAGVPSLPFWAGVAWAALALGAPGQMPVVASDGASLVWATPAAPDLSPYARLDGATFTGAVTLTTDLLFSPDTPFHTFGVTAYPTSGVDGSGFQFQAGPGTARGGNIRFVGGAGGTDKSGDIDILGGDHADPALYGEVRIGTEHTASVTIGGNGYTEITGGVAEGVHVTAPLWVTRVATLAGVLADATSGSDYDLRASAANFYSPAGSVHLGPGDLTVTSSFSEFSHSVDVGEDLTAGTLEVNGAGAFGTYNTADASAILDLVSTARGFLPPRMTTAQRLAIVAPAEGLVVHDLTLHALWQYRSGAWGAVGGAPDLSPYALLAGATFTGASTFAAGLTAKITDAGTATVAVASTVAHALSSGTAAAGIGAATLYRAQNAGGALVDAAQLAGVLTTVTAGNEASAVEIWTRTGGAALARTAKFWGSGGVAFGAASSIDPGAGNVVIPNASTIYARNAANNTNLLLLNLSGGDKLTVGSTSADLRLASSGDLRAYDNTGVEMALLTPALFVIGRGAGDNWPTPSAPTIRPPHVIAGTLNAAPPSMVLGGQLGTGTGAASRVRVQGSVSGTTGTAQHALASTDLAQFQDSTAASDTALLVRVNRAGAFSLDRVVIGATDSGGTGFRMLRIAN